MINNLKNLRGNRDITAEMTSAHIFLDRIDRKKLNYDDNSFRVLGQTGLKLILATRPEKIAAHKLWI